MFDSFPAYVGLLACWVSLYEASLMVNDAAFRLSILLTAACAASTPEVGLERGPPPSAGSPRC